MIKKTHNRTSAAVSYVLFALAALLTVILIAGIIQLHAAAGSSGALSITRLGAALYAVYGFSAFLIPVFLVVSGMFCLDDRWSPQGLICLAISFIPFFTIAFAEHISRKIAMEDIGPIAVTKILILMAIAILVAVMEYLTALVLSTPALRKELKPKLQEYKEKTLTKACSFIKKNTESFSLKFKKDVLEADDEGPAGADLPEQAGQDAAAAPVSREGVPQEDSADPAGAAPAEAALDGEASPAAGTAAPDAGAAPVSADHAGGSAEATADAGQADAAQQAEDDRLFDEADHEAGMQDDGMLPGDGMLLDEDTAIEQAVARSIDAAVESMFDTDGSLLEADSSGQAAGPGTAQDAGSYTAQDALNAADSPAQAYSPAQADSRQDSDYIEPYEDAEIDGGNVDYSFRTKSPGFCARSFQVCEEAPIQDDSDGSDYSVDARESAAYREAAVLPTEALADMPSLSPVFTKMEYDAKEAVGDTVPPAMQELRAEEGDGGRDILDDDGQLSDEQLLDVSDEFPLEEDDDTEDRFLHDDDSAFDIVEDDAEDGAAPQDEAEGSLPEHVDALLEAADDDADTEDRAAAEDRAGTPASAVQMQQQDAAAAGTKAAAASAALPRKSRAPYSISTDLLNEYDDNPYWIIDDETKQAATNLMATLSEFGIQADVTGIRKGPVVTMFELLPAPGVKLSKIAGLQDNIALRLAASSVRIVAPIPGKKAVGIEIPNKSRATVSFRECIEEDLPEWKKFGVPVVLGKNIEGEKVVIDLVKTPHLLIAGSTGSGKSVCVNSMILSILYKRSPDQVKMILIDPKIVELKLYNDIPHLLTPVITEPKRAMQALQYCLCEMERRYSLLDGMGARDISNYNKKISERRIAAEKLPYLIVVIDEFADLMATTGKQLETVLARLAAMSRAVGIHLVLATQRPSIDVITGLIKANIPSRIAFMVASKTDSRIIIDQMGAEKLLGKGDMLYASSTDPFPVRIQGTFVSDQEVENVVARVKEWGEPEYIDDEIFVPEDDEEEAEQMTFSDGNDPLYDKALDIVVQAGKASASYIQRRLKIGYNRAARLVEEMEERGIVGPAQGSKPRELIQIP